MTEVVKKQKQTHIECTSVDEELQKKEGEWLMLSVAHALGKRDDDAARECEKYLPVPLFAFYNLIYYVTGKETAPGLGEHDEGCHAPKVVEHDEGCSKRWTRSIYKLRKPLLKLLHGISGKAARNPKRTMLLVATISIVLLIIGLFTGFSVEASEEPWSVKGSLPIQVSAE